MIFLKSNGQLPTNIKKLTNSIKIYLNNNNAIQYTISIEKSVCNGKD